MGVESPPQAKPKQSPLQYHINHQKWLAQKLLGFNPDDPDSKRNEVLGEWAERYAKRYRDIINKKGLEKALTGDDDAAREVALNTVLECLRAESESNT